MPEEDHSPDSDAEHISHELKQHNKGLFLCSLYFKKDQQDSAQALFQFYLELKKIPHTISEPILGQIRTTWWRDLIRDGTPKEAGSPLGRAILRTIDKHGLDAKTFYSLLEAVTEDIYIQTYPTQKQLETHIDATAGTFFSLLRHVAEGPESGQEINTIIKAAGRAYGLASTLYEMPMSLQHHQHYFTLERLQAFGLSNDDILARDTSEKITSLFRAGEKEALHWLDKANKALLAGPQGQAAFTPLAFVRPLLKLIGKNPNPLNEIIPLNPLSFQWHLWKSARKGQF